MTRTASTRPFAAPNDLAAPALIEDDRPLSYAELRDRSLRCAAALEGLGIGAGDRVGIWLPNCAAWLVSFFACSALGVIAVSINKRYRSGELADLLHRSGCRTLILWPSFAARATIRGSRTHWRQAGSRQGQPARSGVCNVRGWPGLSARTGRVAP